MSLKIPYGLRIRSNVSSYDLLEALKAFQKKRVDYYFKLLESEGITWSAAATYFNTRIVDRLKLPNHFRLEQIKETFFLFHYNGKRANKKESFSLGFFQGSAIGPEHHEDPFFSGMFEDFSYWNNSDKPDDVDTKEWRFRNKVWNTVLMNGEESCVDFDYVAFGFPVCSFELVQLPLLFDSKFPKNP